MTESVELTAIYEPVENGWVQARIEELPEVITVGRDESEAKELLLDALREYLLSLGTLTDAARKPLVAGRRERLEISLTA